MDSRWLVYLWIRIVCYNDWTYYVCRLKEKTLTRNVYELSECPVNFSLNWWHVPVKLWKLIINYLWLITTVNLWLAINVNLRLVIRLWSTIVAFCAASSVCILTSGH